MHRRTDCFFVPIMSTLFVYLSTCHVPPISYSNKLILCLCWDTDGWYIFLGRQYKIRSGFGISPHPSPRLLPDGDPISQTEGRPLEMVALILRCSPLMLDNESGNEMCLDQSQASIQVTWSVLTNESLWCLIMSLGCNERRRTDTLPGAARLRLLYSLLSWQMERTKQSQIRYIWDWIGRQDLTSTQIMLLKYNQSHEMPPKFSPKLLQNAICRVDLVRFRAVICFWEFELQRSPHYSTKVNHLKEHSLLLYLWKAITRE